ncbi:MAG: ATP-dependent helicase [Acidimicrobiales bacterium]
MAVTKDLTPLQLEALTPAQHKAVTTRSETVCVLAGAGAGKTRVLTSRAWHRVATGSAQAEHMLAITFTRKAANELKQRLGALGAASAAKTLTAGTFHSLAASQLRRWWADRRTPEPAFLGHKARLVAELLAGRPGLEDVSLTEMVSHIEWARARDVPPGDFAQAATAAGRQMAADADAIAGLYSRYENEKRRRRLVDYDDLLSRYALALETDSRFAAAQRWRWQHVLVDELQDINPLQFRMLRALLGPNQDLFVVGDPNQAIYGWNGADPAFLGNFARLWPQAEVLHLDENHRCTPQVVKAAAAVLGMSGARLSSSQADGPLPSACSYPTEDAEAQAVASQMCEARARGVPWGQMAALARTNAQLPVIAEALRNFGVPANAVAPEHELADRDAEPGENDSVADRATLCTFHRAKGLQWHAVWVCGLESGLVPIGYALSEDAIAEERRLLYVALTRAERELHCSWAQSRRAPNGVALGRSPSPWWETLKAHSAERPAHLPEGDKKAPPKHFLAMARGRLALSPSDKPADSPVAERLRAWRQRTARASGVPPHVVLHDATLKEIAARSPASIEDLLDVPGLGPVKVSRFGPAILEAVRTDAS